jgi:hypothetical protein
MRSHPTMRGATTRPDPHVTAYVLLETQFGGYSRSA